jgi:hypothetical protein
MVGRQQHGVMFTEDNSRPETETLQERALKECSFHADADFEVGRAQIISDKEN